MSPRFAPLPMALAICVLLLSGCGGASSSAPASSETTPTNGVAAAALATEAYPIVTRDELVAFLTPPTSAFEHLRAVPIASDGGQLGYRLYGIRMGSLAARVGLRNGDLVVRLEGVALRTTNVAREALDAALAADEIDVDLDRGGVPVTLRVTVTP